MSRFVLFAVVLCLGAASALAQGHPDVTSSKMDVGATKNYAGYVTVNNTRNLFYWFFESQSNPATDPFILWMTGGPGCSGMLALFFENGPFQVLPDLNLTANPYSWNTKANILFIDQPVGVGFSFDTSATDPGVTSEAAMAENMYEFFQKWFQYYPKYANLPFYISAESYGGHYGPALAGYIVRHNSPSFRINLKGLTVGNGLVDPLLQYPQYEPYAADHKLIGSLPLGFMKYNIPACLNKIQHCSNNTVEDCVNAYDFCNEWELNPVLAAGWNPYDIREKCPTNEPLCYNLTGIQDYLNLPSTKKTLGVPSHITWVPCSNQANSRLVLAGDWMMDYIYDVPLVLENGVKVLIYHGDEDFIVNWYGGNAWTQGMQWEYQGDFRNSPLVNWTVGSTPAGTYHTYANFTFLRVFNAGHMVPHDQPAVALSMINGFMNNTFPGPQ